MDLTRFGTDFQAIYMDPPLLREGEEAGPNKITMQQLSTINIGPILPKGFLFVWVEKEFLPEMVLLAESWDMRYVENFCWIKRNANNQIVRDRSPYFNSSKLSLLIFRKVTLFFGRAINLTDVDLIRDDKDGECLLRAVFVFGCQWH